MCAIGWSDKALLGDFRKRFSTLQVCFFNSESLIYKFNSKNWLVWLSTRGKCFIFKKAQTPWKWIFLLLQRTNTHKIKITFFIISLRAPKWADFFCLRKNKFSAFKQIKEDNPSKRRPKKTFKNNKSCPFKCRSQHFLRPCAMFKSNIKKWNLEFGVLLAECPVFANITPP